MGFGVVRGDCQTTRCQLAAGNCRPGWPPFRRCERISRHLNRGMLSDMQTSRAFKSLAQWSVCALAVPLLTSASIDSVQAQSSHRPFWTEQAMFRFGGELYFVGVASCARTAEEGRTRAFEAALTELRGYAQDRDTSRLLVATQMIYEEPNSPACPHGSTSVWRLLRVDQSQLAHLPRQHREVARGPSSSSSSLPIFLLLLNVRNHSFKT